MVRGFSRPFSPLAIGTLQTGYHHTQDLSPVPWCQTPHPTGEGSGATACPCGSRPASSARLIWHRYMHHGTGHFTRQERASILPRVPRLQTCLPVRRDPVSPCAPWHRARHPTGEGSGVITCLMALDSSSTHEGTGVITCPRHQNHRPTGLRYHHVSSGSRPASRCGRALEPPRAL
jgi:hypothetical protein